MNEKEIKQEIEKYKTGLKVFRQQHDEVEYKMAKVQGILEYLQTKLKESKQEEIKQEIEKE